MAVVARYELKERQREVQQPCIVDAHISYINPLPTNSRRRRGWGRIEKPSLVYHQRDWRKQTAHHTLTASLLDWAGFNRSRL